MAYISLFSGIGGLEHPSIPPILLCEIDNDCRKILSSSYPTAVIYPDVETLAPPQCDVVCGGWPCQDISIAGTQLGLGGSRSKLFYSLLRIAVEASAESIVAENVPNLLRIAKGEEFLNVLRAFQDAGYPFISWRILNAREFGLPQERRRLLIVASEGHHAWQVSHQSVRLATNLDDYVDLSDPSSLSSQAAAGILVRTVRASGMLPIDLFDLLCELASRRVGPVVGSRSNSFEVLDREIDLKEYRTVLTRELKEQIDTDDGQMSLDFYSDGTGDVMKEGAL